MTPFLIALSLLTPSYGAAEEKGEDYDAQLTKIEGSVEVRDKAEAEYHAAEEGLPLEVGDTIRTGADGRAEVGLDGDSVVMLQENTRFTIGSTRRSNAFMSLSLGTLLAKFSSLGKADRFRIKTFTAVAAIRGTEFGVSADDAGSRVGVFDEGEVAVLPPDESNEVLLKANQETEILTGAAPVPPRALKYFAFHRQRMSIVRSRLKTIRGRWKKRNMRQRDRWKKRLERRLKRRGGQRGPGRLQRP